MHLWLAEVPQLIGGAWQGYSVPNLASLHMPEAQQSRRPSFLWQPERLPVGP